MRLQKEIKIRERDVESYLVKRVKMLGGEVRKVQWIGRRGAPDRLVMLPEVWRTVQLAAYGFAPSREDQWLDRPARTIWVEVKAPGKKPEPHQQREHERMRAMGQRVEVVDSYNAVDEVLKW